jgi:hypothetical protein
MKKQIRAALAAVMIVGVLSLHAQTSTTAPAKTTSSKAKTSKPKVVRETAEQRAIRELQEKMAAQQAEIDSLKQANAAKDAALAAAQSTAASAQSQAATAQSQAAEATTQAQTAAAAAQSQADAVSSLKNTVADQQNMNAGLVESINTAKADLNTKIDSPTAIHYKGVTITPVAFFAFENVWRQRAVNSDINTPFNTIPLPSATQGHVANWSFPDVRAVWAPSSRATRVRSSSRATSKATSWARVRLPTTIRATATSCVSDSSGDRLPSTADSL